MFFLIKTNYGDKMKKDSHTDVELDREKDKFNEHTSNIYYDYVQMGPLEEEILTEFYFDTNRFEEYLKRKELNNVVNNNVIHYTK